MAEQNLKENLEKLLWINVTISLFIGLSLVLYATFYDYGLYEIYQIISGLVTDNVIGNWVLAPIESFLTTYLLIPTFVDYMFLVSITLFFMQLIYASYHTGRESYYSSLSALTVGLIFSLFVLGISLQVSEWFNVQFIGLLFDNLSTLVPFYTMYLDNAGLINTIVIVVCILANNTDLDLAQYFTRKEKESLVRNDEVN